MHEKNITIVESYYKAMRAKDTDGMAAYLHADVEFVGPLAELTGRETVIAGARGLVSIINDVVIRAKFGSANQVMLAYDLDCVPPIGKVRTAALMTLKDELITRIEIFCDSKSFGRP